MDTPEIVGISVSIVIMIIILIATIIRYVKKQRQLRVTPGQMTPFEVDDTRTIILQHRNRGMERDAHRRQVGNINAKISAIAADRQPHTTTFAGRTIDVTPAGHVTPRLAALVGGDTGYLSRNRGLVASDFRNVEDWE